MWNKIGDKFLKWDIKDFCLFCWKIWDKLKNVNYSEMIIYYYKFYGIDK